MLELGLGVFEGGLVALAGGGIGTAGFGKGGEVVAIDNVAQALGFCGGMFGSLVAVLRAVVLWLGVRLLALLGVGSLFVILPAGWPAVPDWGLGGVVAGIALLAGVGAGVGRFGFLLLARVCTAGGRLVVVLPALAVATAGGFGILLLARVGAAVGWLVAVLGSVLTVAAALGFVVLRFGR